MITMIIIIIVIVIVIIIIIITIIIIIIIVIVIIIIIIIFRSVLHEIDSSSEKLGFLPKTDNSGHKRENEYLDFSIFGFVKAPSFIPKRQF